MRAGRICRVIRAAVLAMLVAGAAWAQSEPAPQIDYAAWDRLAARAETVIDSERASTPAFEDLRRQLAEARTGFAAGQTAESARIASLRDQIKALGPAPEEGATEDAEVKARRDELNARLAELQAPVLRAQEAFRRANGLIGEIDGIIRQRQTSKLLEFGPTPLSPQAWGAALSAAQQTARSVWLEARRALDNPTRLAETRPVLPRVLGYLVLAMLLILRGRRWMAQATAWFLRAGPTAKSSAAIAFVVSLGEIAVPYLGVLALVEALTETSLIWIRGGYILDLVPDLALVILTGRWIGARVFSTNRPLLALGQTQLRAGRVYSSTVGITLGLYWGLRDLMAFESYSAEAIAVINMALVLATALALIRLALILLGACRKTDEADAVVAGDGLLARTLVIVGRGVILLSVLGPAAAAVGYGQLGTVVFSIVQTLWVIGLWGILQRLARDLHVAFRGTGYEAANAALIPVIVDVLLALAALPVLALIWGARVSDLTELWTLFMTGIAVGDTRISPSNFLTLAIVFLVFFLATRIMQSALRNSILPKTRIDQGGRVALVSGVGYVGIFLAAVIAITAAGIDLSSLALVAGALSIGIGFGLQTIVSNFVAGIILLIERPVSEGDWIEVAGTMGTVRDISVRATRIETFDRTDVIVPNADLISGMVTNYTRGNTLGRAVLSVGVAYDTDTRRVEKILEEIAAAHPMVASYPAPSVVFVAIGAESFNFDIRVILRDVNYIMNVKSDLYHEIVARLAAEGIEMPYATRDIWLRNPSSLTGAGSPDTGGNES